MNRNSKMLSIIVGIIFLVFNCVVFITPVDKGTNFWVGYVFAFLTAIIFEVILLLSVNKKVNLDKAFLNIPIYYYSIVFGVFGLLFNTIAMLVPHFSVRIEVIANVLVIAIYFIGVILAKIAIDEISASEKLIKEKVFYIKSLIVEVQGMKRYAANEYVLKKLNELEETIQYSDPMSHAQLITIENQIQYRVAELQNQINIPGIDVVPLINEIIQLFAQRNANCKILK